MATFANFYGGGTRPVPGPGVAKGIDIETEAGIVQIRANPVNKNKIRVKLSHIKKSKLAPMGVPAGLEFENFLKLNDEQKTLKAGYIGRGYSASEATIMARAATNPNSKLKADLNL